VDRRITSTIAVLTILLVTAPIVSVAVAQEPPREPSELPVVEFHGVGRLRVALIIELPLEQVLELAYTIRNLTYPLYQWEIERYNITVARVVFDKADGFLERAINLSSTHPVRAKVFAFVAAVLYSHAPAYANPVLAKVIRANLGENETITDKTVEAVISTAQELREILVGAINYAKEKGYNVTVAEKMLAKADERLANATTKLEEGNITIAFGLAVSAYRGYVRAYTFLVKSVFAQFIRATIASLIDLVEVQEPPARKFIGHLPVKVREMIKGRVERGEINTTTQVFEEIKTRVQAQLRNEIQLREKEQLKTMVKEKIKEIREKYKVEINDEELVKLIEEYYARGYRGLELAKRVLDELASRLGRLGIQPPIPPIKPPTPPRR
jgi:hypothetical protein